ncbi:ExeM/NucH family extracellular endonuclease, partial [Pricia sp.]|uniref:ExeM/NucH family extracellular endonuclease n=1 Tax=Pricia sp. TaxID=2268138 RepID=UPI0035930E2C
SAGKAIVIPVTNVTSLPGAAAGSSVFGAPIELNLGGRSLRSLECNSNGCLGIAGPVGSVSDFKLYTWSGVPTDAAELRSANVFSSIGGSYEGIVGLPATPFLGSDGDAQSIQLMIDLGATTLYNDGVENKDQILQWKKFQTETVTLGGIAVPTLTDPLINEFVVDDPGTDEFEFVEIFGDANTDYSSYTLLQIEGDSGAGSGTVDSVLPLGTTDSNGLWTTDLFLANEFENGTITFLLVKNFTGAKGDDLDTDDDGVLDSAPWDAIVDSVGKDDSDSEFVYSEINLSPNYDGISFEVGGASRIPNGTDNNAITDWVRNDFDGAGLPDQEGSPVVGEALNTPGALNRLVPPPGPDLQITEIWPGNENGDNLTADWFEITNTGNIAWTPELGDLYFDDDSQDPTSASLISGITSIAPGESVIAIDAADADNFIAVWGGVYELTSVQVGTYAGAGLSGGGDGVTLFQGEPSAETLIDFEEYPDVAVAPGASYDVEKVGFSVVGEPPFLPVATAPNNEGESAVGSPGNRGPVITTTTVKIHEVQGNGPVAALEGQTLTINAIVVGTYQNEDQLNGFFVQEEDADADADTTTSEGIFVYCDTCAESVEVGDEVEVTGLVVEFFNMSQLEVTAVGGKVLVLSAGNNLPTPAAVNLPSNGSTANTETFENVEGMLVNFTSSLFVSEYFALGRFGQLTLTTGSRPRQFTDENVPDENGYAEFLGNLERSRIILDDDNNLQNDAIGAIDEPYFWPRPGLSNGNLVRGGDEISGLTGIMHWSFSGQQGTDAWRIRPVEPAFDYSFTSNNPRQDTPDDVGGTLKVASFNVLNYFTTLDERGADSAAELDRQRAKIASAICAMDADIVGLIEIENNGLTAVNDLLNGTNGINSVCGPYTAIETGTIGTDQIAVAFIYKSDTVEPIGDFSVLDSSIDPRFLDTKNRPALAQTFMEIASSEVLTVAVNHLKSKGSGCTDVGDPDLNDGSANCNTTRTDAAAALVDWLATDPTASADSDFLIIGDLNSYRKETPIDAIKLGADDTAETDDDYVDLIDTNLGADGYSYVFDGQQGYLDYALANTNLASQVTGVTEWHINADEINIFDYNDGIQDAGEQSFERESNALPVYGPNAFRASDHDPVLVGLQLTPDVVAPEPSVLTVEKLILVNADTNEDIMEIVEGSVIDLSTLTTNRFTMRADATDDVNSVYFELSGKKVSRKIENLSPFALYGDFGGNYAGEEFRPGNYRIRTVPFSKTYLRGDRGTGLTANFSIVGGALGDIETAKISPNPAKWFTKISFDGPVEVNKVLLFNAYGWLVRNYTGDRIKKGDEYILTLGFLRRGVHFVVITDNYGNKVTRKLIIG